MPPMDNPCLTSNDFDKEEDMDVSPADILEELKYRIFWENLENNFRKEQKAFKLSNSDLSQTQQAIRELHEKFLKSLEAAEKDNNDLATNSGGELKKQAALFQRNLIKHITKYCSYDNISD